MRTNTPSASTRLRIQGEKLLQQVQGLYRSLFDKDIPGIAYDYTL